MSNPIFIITEKLLTYMFDTCVKHKDKTPRGFRKISYVKICGFVQVNDNATNQTKKYYFDLV